MQEHNTQQRDYGLQLWWPVLNSGIRCSRLEPLTITYHDKREMRPHSLVTQLMVSASACAFTTTLNHFATVVMFHNITPVTYGLPVSKMLTTSSGVTTDESTAAFLVW